MDLATLDSAIVAWAVRTPDGVIYVPCDIDIQAGTRKRAEQEAQRFQGRGGAWQIVPLVSLPEVAALANTLEVVPETARTYTDYRRLPIGSVVLSHTGRYAGWAWQKVSAREWWARESNWLPTMKMPTTLGQTTIVYRANSGRVGRPEKGPAT